MSVLESDKQLRLVIASSDGYIKLYDICIKVCNLQKASFVVLSILNIASNIVSYYCHHMYLYSS